MFEATRLTFYYAVTPVHMGAGSAIGAIDNPIQREVHTQHPVFAGSGLKGALRHHFNRVWPRVPDRNGHDALPDPLISRIFGPETGASDYAGAFSLSDAQLVILPVRALKRGFAYATCPLALARVKRLAELAKVPVPWTVPDLPPGPPSRALVAGETLLWQGHLVLEAFEFQKADGDCRTIARWMRESVLPAGEAHEYFAQKVETDLVVLSDTDFAHFARHAMVVEPHVRINDESGTADDGGLFYTENLPPESVLAGLAQASVERFKKDGRKEGAPPLLKPEQVLDAVFVGDKDRPGIADRPLQIGGDATVGRGLVLVHPVRQGG